MEEDIDECYDVFAIALCHAAQCYNDKKRCYGFDEYAKVVMLSEYFEYKNKCNY